MEVKINMKASSKNYLFYAITVSMVLLNFISILIPAISDFLLLISVIVFIISCILYDYDKNFGLLLFYTSFQVLEFKIIEISYFNIISSVFVFIFSIKYTFLCISKNKKIYWLPLLFSIVLCLWSCIDLDFSQIFYVIANFVLFGILYLTYAFKEELNIKYLCKRFIYGILISTMFGFILYLIPEFKDIVLLSNRFRGISGNPNTLQFLIVIAISIMLSLYFRNQISKIAIIILNGYLTILGFLTMSKAFIVCFIILAIIYFILMFIKNKKQALKELLLFIACLVFIILLFLDKFKSIFSRFFIYEYDNLLDNILTGRFSLWETYLDYWSTSILTILFGCGVSHKQPISLGSHSGYIDIVYKFGILGVILICGLSFSYYLESKHKKKGVSFINFIPLLMFLIISMEEFLFSSMRCVFVLCLLLLYEYNDNNTQNEILNSRANDNKIFSKIKFLRPLDILLLSYLAIVIIPALITKIFVRDYWLVCEDKNEARDNGYWFFKYVRENYPEQKIAYAINKNSPDYQKVANLGKVINFGGLSHWFWFLVSDKNISSQKNGKPNAAICYLFEVVLKLRKNNRVFLQHGVTINDAKFLYYKNTNIRLFVTATKPENDYILSKFGYPKENVKLLGFPRFDNLNNNEVDKDIILVMPTWRQWIAKEVEIQDIEGTNNFLETEYFKRWSEFINSKKLQVCLEKYHKKILFFPHRNMQKYLKNFHTTNKNIEICDWKSNDIQEMLKKSAIMITDYSSVFFDFVYMKKPVIFYQFDEEKFRKYQYNEGYFDYKNNGMSLWADNIDNLIYNLENVLSKNNYKISDDKYSDYFAFCDKLNSQRVYYAIKGLKKKNVE